MDTKQNLTCAAVLSGSLLPQQAYPDMCMHVHTSTQTRGVHDARNLQGMKARALQHNLQTPSAAWGTQDVCKHLVFCPHQVANILAVSTAA